MANHCRRQSEGDFLAMTPLVDFTELFDRNLTHGRQVVQVANGANFVALVMSDSDMQRVFNVIYGRIVGKVWVQPVSCPTCPMTLDATHAQITVGLAWWYRAHENEQSLQYRGAYEFSEEEARVKRVGLLRDLEPVPPFWDY